MISFRFKNRLWHNINKKDDDKDEGKINCDFSKSPYGYIGFIEELPGANTQGKQLLDEARQI